MKANWSYILLFTLIFSFMLTGCSSDPDEDGNGEGNGDGTGNNLETVISELKKDERLTEFVKTLETMEISNSSLTVFAVLNDALEDEDGISEDMVKLHIIEGKYNKDALAEIQKIKTLSGIELSIDSYGEPGVKSVTGPDSKTIYVNGIVVGDMLTGSDNNTIYIMNKAIPPSITPPALSNSTEYLEWLTDRLDGLWQVIHTESFTVRYDWDGYSENRTIIPKDIAEMKDLENKLYLGFSKSKQYIGKLIYGMMKATSVDGVERIIPEFIGSSNDNLFYWGYDTYNAGRAITITNNSLHPTIEVFQYLGSAKIHTEKGIGTRMIIGTNQRGYELYPPNHYPSEKDSTAITLVKKNNVW